MSTVQRCKRCGGVLGSQLEYSSDHFCNCPLETCNYPQIPNYCNYYPHPSGYSSYGWICPRCGQSNAPFKMTCDCTAFNQFTPSLSCAPVILSNNPEKNKEDELES